MLKMEKFLWCTILVLFSVLAVQSQEDCLPCDKVTCPEIYECVAGVTPDRCGCCQICARSETELCDVSWAQSKDQSAGICGDNLECVYNQETMEQLCVCRETGQVCGNDELTYSSPCALNEESVRRDSAPNLPQLSMAYWGPCIEAPTIISPPSDTYGPVGANLTLDCEARGFPAPIITWQYDDVDGNTIYLPSDDQDISIQMRGGPDANMVTGWAQILSLEPSYSGVYHCIAENNQGKVHARAVVGVYRKEL